MALIGARTTSDQEAASPRSASCCSSTTNSQGKCSRIGRRLIDGSSSIDEARQTLQEHRMNAPALVQRQQIETQGELAKQLGVRFALSTRGFSVGGDSDSNFLRRFSSIVRIF